MRSSTQVAMLVALVSLAAGACAVARPPALPDADELATRVSGTLTAIPPAIPLPPAIETAAPSPTEPPAATEAPPTPTETPAASATTLPSLTPTPSLTPLATRTLPADDPRATLGNPTWRDEFASGANWPLGEDSFTRAQVVDGELILTGLTTTDGWRLTWPVVKDFYLEMRVETGTCAGSDHYGLIARVPDLHAANRGYLFGVTCDGRYSLRAWDGEAMTNLVRATASASIEAGSAQVNRVGLLATGNQLILYVNGVRLIEFEDSRFSEEGSFGVFVGARQTSNFAIHVSEIGYWENP
ncbi:MAG: hypothetical protein ACRDHG_02315 [Anaerolineales bacterium]